MQYYVEGCVSRTTIVPFSRLLKTKQKQNKNNDIRQSQFLKLRIPSIRIKSQSPFTLDLVGLNLQFTRT